MDIKQNWKYTYFGKDFFTPMYYLASHSPWGDREPDTTEQLTQKHTYALPIPINRKKASQNFWAGRLWKLHLKTVLPICVHLHSSDEELLQNNYMQKCGWYKLSHLVGLYYKNQKSINEKTTCSKWSSFPNSKTAKV